MDIKDHFLNGVRVALLFIVIGFHFAEHFVDARVVIRALTCVETSS